MVETPLLVLDDLHASVDGTEILKGVTLTINPGETHAIMGPNGSGKSTLAYVLLGHPAYVVTKGTITYKGEDITKAKPEVRGKSGMFLGFQYPQEIAGVSVVNFLRTALSNRTGIEYTVLELRLKVMEAMRDLGMEDSFADRYLNEGFSGGERNWNEILQRTIPAPHLAALDEPRSRLDVDAWKHAANGVSRSQRLQDRRPRRPATPHRRTRLHPHPPLAAYAQLRHT